MLGSKIDYRSFGEETDIVPPGSDLLLGMDEFAELKPYGGTPETCDGGPLMTRRAQLTISASDCRSTRRYVCSHDPLAER